VGEREILGFVLRWISHIFKKLLINNSVSQCSLKKQLLPVQLRQKSQSQFFTTLSDE